MEAINNLNKNTDLRNNMISYIVNSKSTSKMSDKQYDALENKLLQKSFAQLKKEYDILKAKNQMKNGGGVEWDKDSDSIRTELGEFRVRITPEMERGYYEVYVSANKKEIGKKYDVYGIDNAKDIALEMISNSNKFDKGSTVKGEEKSTYKYYKVPNEQLWAIQECNSVFEDGWGSTCVVIGTRKSEAQAIDHVKHLTKLQLEADSKYKDGGDVGKDKVFEVAYYGKKHLKQRGSSKRNYLTWVVAINREEAIEKVKNDDDEFAELKSAKPTNLDVERYKMKNGGGVDINELNIPVIRTQFEDEEYEFKDGGEVGNIKERVIDYYINNSDNEDLINLIGVSDIPNLKQVAEVWVNNRDSYYNKIFNAIDGIHNRTWAENKFEELGLDKHAEGGTTKGFCYTIGGL